MSDQKSPPSAAAEAEPSKGAANPAGPRGGGGGFAAWLPLLLALVAMPALAYATTTFFIVPQIQRATGQTSATPAAGASSPAAGGEHGAPAPQGAAAKAKHSVAMSKMIVNVAGTMGTRYLLTSLTLVGASPGLKDLVEEHRDQLLDVATSTLSNKTIADLEKPGARNQIRGELMGVFNNVLGENAVNEIFITEFAIQ
jgi:flagellar FliL protein